MKIISYDDIVGDGVKHQLVTLLKKGGALPAQANWDTKWWQAVMVSSAGTTRIGDVDVSATNGIPLPGTSQFVPPIAFATDRYELNDVYVIIPVGDVMSVARAV